MIPVIAAVQYDTWFKANLKPGAKLKGMTPGKNLYVLAHQDGTYTAFNGHGGLIGASHKLTKQQAQDVLVSVRRIGGGLSYVLGAELRLLESSWENYKKVQGVTAKVEVAYEVTEEQIRSKLAELESDLKRASKHSIRQFIIDQIDELEERLRRVVRQRQIMTTAAIDKPPYYQEFLEKISTSPVDGVHEVFSTITIYVPHDKFKEFLDVVHKENATKRSTYFVWRIRDGKPFVKKMPKASHDVMSYTDFRGAYF